MNRTVDQEIQWQAAVKQVYLAIQEAWCNPPAVKAADTFGAFLERATDAVLALPEIRVETEDQYGNTLDAAGIGGSLRAMGFVRVIPK